ncbi:histone-lysine N-methyltransferase [Pseudohyphozyma bogoriensis]|nr:histone-lysine N-methyltransferase [Pseudohyphozyma bogoriensis]
MAQQKVWEVLNLLSPEPEVPPARVRAPHAPLQPSPVSPPAPPTQQSTLDGFVSPSKNKGKQVDRGATKAGSSTGREEGTSADGGTNGGARRRSTTGASDKGEKHGRARKEKQKATEGRSSSKKPSPRPVEPAEPNAHAEANTERRRRRMSGFVDSDDDEGEADEDEAGDLERQRSSSVEFIEHVEPKGKDNERRRSKRKGRVLSSPRSPDMYRNSRLTEDFDGAYLEQRATSSTTKFAAARSDAEDCPSVKRRRVEISPELSAEPPEQRFIEVDEVPFNHGQGFADDDSDEDVTMRRADSEVASVAPNGMLLCRHADLTNGLFISEDDAKPVDPALVLSYQKHQGTLRTWQRSLVGPTWTGEFSDGLKQQIARQPELQNSPDYTQMFQHMIDLTNAEESPGGPKVHICPPTHGNGPYAPPAELIWTRRVNYPQTVLPRQAPGCGCVGNCGDPRNRKTCECLKRQIAAFRSRNGDDRSNRKDFAYDKKGLAHHKEIYDDPIIECNSQCGCGPGCINKVVGRGPKVNLDIFYTGHGRSWGLRIPFESQRIPEGTPIGIYAGDLILPNIEFWHILADLEASSAVVKTTGGRPSDKKGKLKRADLDATPDVEEDRSVGEIDAFRLGNFTRYMNHHCSPNTAAKAVYTEDADIRRPLIVFFALKDLEPGQEVCISYYHSFLSPELPEGQSLKEYRRLAASARKNAAADRQCRCGHDLCRGVMFKAASDS